MKNRKLISREYWVDSETGEEIFVSSKNTNPNSGVKVASHFIKIHDRAIKELNDNLLGKLCKLKPFIEWRTNRLVFKHVGRKPKALKQNDIAEILEVTSRTVSTIIKKLVDVCAIFRFGGEYYLNPAFIGGSNEYESEIICKMMTRDFYLEYELNKNDLKGLRKLIRFKNMLA